MTKFYCCICMTMHAKALIFKFLACMLAAYCCYIHNFWLVHTYVYTASPFSDLQSQVVLIYHFLNLATEIILCGSWVALMPNIVLVVVNCILPPFCNKYLFIAHYADTVPIKRDYYIV